MASIYILMEGKTSLNAIAYYLKHREQLKDERTLARVWLTKGKEKKTYEKNIIQTIDAILEGIVAVEETLKTHLADPLHIVIEGDVLMHNLILSSEEWVFKQGRLVYKKKDK